MPIREYAIACTSNKTDASFPSKVPTVTAPTTGTGIIDVSDFNTENILELMPYSIGADDTTYSMRVIGWRKVSTLWTPTVLAELACVASTAVGVADAAVLNTERFADAITVVSSVGVVIVTAVPANTPARAILDISAFQKIEFTFDMTGATSANVLYCQY